MRYRLTILNCIGLISLSFLLACNNYSNTNSTASDTAPVLNNTTKGKEIFESRCIACHGINGRYRDLNAADLHLSTLDSIGIATTIRNGRNQMPSFGIATISDADLGQLEQYVMTLRKQ